MAGGSYTATKFKDIRLSDKDYESLTKDGSPMVDAVKDVGISLGAQTAVLTFEGTSLKQAFSGAQGLTDIKGLLGHGVYTSLFKKRPAMVRKQSVLWVPQSLASTSDEAKQLVQNALYEATISAVEKESLKPVQVSSLMGGDKEYLQVQDDLCYGKNCIGLKDKDAFYYKSAASRLNLTLVTKPAFLDGKAESAWVAWVDGSLYKGQFGCIPNSDMADVEKFFCADQYKEMERAVYAHLPSWVYRYEYDTNENLGVVYQSNTNLAYPLLNRQRIHNGSTK